MLSQNTLITSDWNSISNSDFGEIISRVNAGAVFLVRNCPREPMGVVSLAKKFGNPMSKLAFKHKFSDDPIFRYVGNVSLKHQLAKQERMDTNDHEALTVHTARSYCPVRPRYFALLMADAGWIDFESGKNGETVLVQWERVFAAYQRQYDSYRNDFDLLARESLSYRPWYYPEGDVASEPLVRLRADGKLAVRYWQHMSSFLAKSTVSPHLQEILLRIDKLSNSPENQLVFQMRSGDAYVIDNELIAHGRRYFVGEKSEGSETRFSSRQIYSVHVDPSAEAVEFLSKEL